MSKEPRPPLGLPGRIGTAMALVAVNVSSANALPARVDPHATKVLTTHAARIRLLPRIGRLPGLCSDTGAGGRACPSRPVPAHSFGAANLILSARCGQWR